MNTLKAYKTISFILMPFAGLLGIVTVIMLFMSLMNIAFLLESLLMAAIVVYIIFSLIFLIRGIYQNKNCNPSIRKWIRITGVITFIMACELLFQSFYFLVKPLALSNMIDQMQNLEKSMPQVDTGFAISAVKITLYIMVFFATTLIVHFIETSKFLKIYSSIFDKNRSE